MLQKHLTTTKNYKKWIATRSYSDGDGVVEEYNREHKKKSIIQKIDIKCLVGIIITAIGIIIGTIKGK